MEDGPVWKIATEAARELSQFASTIPDRCCTRTLSPDRNSILHRRELDHGR